MVVYQIESTGYSMGECYSYIREGLIFSNEEALYRYLEKHNIDGEAKPIEVIE